MVTVFLPSLRYNIMLIFSKISWNCSRSFLTFFFPVFFYCFFLFSSLFLPFFLFSVSFQIDVTSRCWGDNDRNQGKKKDYKGEIKPAILWYYCIIYLSCDNISLKVCGSCKICDICTKKPSLLINFKNALYPLNFIIISTNN